MYFFAPKIVKNRSDQNKILKLWRICDGNIFSPLSFLCFAQSLWLGLLCSHSGHRHSSAATRRLRVLKVGSGSAHVLLYRQPKRGKLVRGITFPVLSCQVSSSTVFPHVLSCLVLLPLVFSESCPTVSPHVFSCLVGCVTYLCPFLSCFVVFCFFVRLSGFSFLA